MTIFGSIKKLFEKQEPVELEEDSDIFGLAGHAVHQEIPYARSHVYIFNYTRGISDSLRNRIISAILQALPDLTVDLGRFRIIKINLVGGDVEYFEFPPTRADLENIQPQYTYTLGEYVIGSIPPVIKLNVGTLYKFYLTSKKQTLEDAKYIRRVEGVDKEKLKELVKSSVDEPKFFLNAVKETLRHELIHAYQDKKTKMLARKKRIQNYLSKKMEKFEDFGMKVSVSNATEFISKFVQNLEHFRLLLQIEGLATYCEQTEPKTLQETHNIALKDAINLMEKINRFLNAWGNFFPKVTEDLNEIKEKIEKPRKRKTEEERIAEVKEYQKAAREADEELAMEIGNLGDLMLAFDRAAYSIGLHMVTLLAEHYSIEEIMKMSRYKFLTVYMEGFQELSAEGILEGDLLVSKRNNRGIVGIIDFDMIKTDAFAEYERWRDKVAPELVSMEKLFQRIMKEYEEKNKSD